MKEYLYDDSDFTYLYSDDVSFGPVSKEPQVAGNATLIKPPENVPNGKIPVFNKKDQRWDIVDDAFWRPFKETYSYGIPNLAPGKTSLPELTQMNSVMLRTPIIPKILNPGIAMLKIYDRKKYIDFLEEDVYRLHKLLHRHDGVVSPSVIPVYHFELETLVHQIKRMCDEIITMLYIQVDIENIKIRHTIEVDSIGELLSGQKKAYFPKLLKLTKFEKHHVFLNIINELDNGYKHDLLTCEAETIIGTEEPIISIIRPKKRRNYDYIIHHRHGLNQIMVAFSDFMKDVLEL